MRKVLLSILVGIILLAVGWVGYQVYQVSEITPGQVSYIGTSDGIYRHYEPPGIRIDIGQLIRNKLDKSRTLTVSSLRIKYERYYNLKLDEYGAWKSTK